MAAAPAGSPSPTKTEKPAKAKAKNKDKKKDDKSSGANLFGPGAAGQQSNQQQNGTIDRERKNGDHRQVASNSET